MELLALLNSFSPLGVIALLAYIVYLLVNQRQQVHAIKTNHLHGLPEMLEILHRIELTLVEGFAELRTTLKTGRR